MENLMNKSELPYHRWPKSWGGWQAGSIIRCEGEGCQFCQMHWKLVDNETLEDVPDGGKTDGGE